MIEIDYSDFWEPELPKLLEAAKAALRTCSTYKPPPKGRNARAAKDAEEAWVELATMYPKPQMVKVRCLPQCPPVRNGGVLASLQYPTKVEEYFV